MLYSYSVVWGTLESMSMQLEYWFDAAMPWLLQSMRNSMQTFHPSWTFFSPYLFASFYFKQVKEKKTCSTHTRNLFDTAKYTKSDLISWKIAGLYLNVKCYYLQCKSFFFNILWVFMAFLTFVSFILDIYPVLQTNLLESTYFLPAWS